MAALCFSLSTNGGGIQFLGRSTAGNAAISVDSGAIFFGDASNAGHANILLTNNTGLGFFGASSAANATIHVGTGSGVLFFDESDGGKARLIVDKFGFVDFSGTAGIGGKGTVNIGSIEGSGEIDIGGATAGRGHSLSQIQRAVASSINAYFNRRRIPASRPRRYRAEV